MEVWEAKTETDFKQSLTLKDSAGTVFNTTGYTLSAEVKRDPLSASLATATVTVTSAADGEVDVELTDTQIDAIGPGKFMIDLKVVRDSDSYVFRSVAARLIVERHVTG